MYPSWGTENCERADLADCHIYIYICYIIACFVVISCFYYVSVANRRRYIKDIYRSSIVVPLSFTYVSRWLVAKDALVQVRLILSKLFAERTDPFIRIRCQRVASSSSVQHVLAATQMLLKLVRYKMWALLHQQSWLLFQNYRQHNTGLPGSIS